MLVGDLTSGAELLERSQLRGADDRIQLAKTTEQVLALKQRLPGLVVLAGPDPTAAQRLLNSAQ